MFINLLACRFPVGSPCVSLLDQLPWCDLWCSFNFCTFPPSPACTFLCLVRELWLRCYCISRFPWGIPHWTYVGFYPQSSSLGGGIIWLTPVEGPIYVRALRYEYLVICLDLRVVASSWYHIVAGRAPIYGRYVHLWTSTYLSSSWILQVH